MTTKLLLSFMALGFIFSCKNKEEASPVVEAPVEPYKMTKIWESDTLFTTVESVIYDPATGIIYASNIDGQPWEADGKGSIGKLNADGTTIDAKWVTGLHAPKGLGIVNGKLYVADITDLLEIDLADGKILNRYAVEGAVGLNDVTTSPDGVVYFTDSQKGSIHMLKENTVSTLLDSLKGSNGILYEPERLLVATWSNESLNEFKMSDGSFTAIADSLPQPDGIEAVGDGGYLVSAWKGMIHYVHPDGTTELILDTTSDTISAADIDYVPEKKLVLIPTFFRNTVAAYELSK